MDESKMTLRECFRINCRAIAMIPKLIPWNIFLDLVLASINVVRSYWNVFFLAWLIDDIVAGMPRERIVWDAVILVAGGGAVNIIEAIMRFYYYYCGSNIWERANLYLNRKIMDMDYEYMESESVQNRRRNIDLIARHSGGGFNLLFWRLHPLVMRSIHVLVAVVYIIRLMVQSRLLFPGKPLLAAGFVLLFGVLFGLLLFVNIWKNKTAQEGIINAQDEMTPFWREYNFYAEEYIGHSGTAKDIRLFRQQNLLTEHIGKLFDQLDKKVGQMRKLDSERRVWIGITEAVISGLIYMMLGIMALKGAISIGSIWMYAGCINNFLQHFHRCIMQLVEITKNSKYLKEYFDFLDIPNKKYEGTLPMEKRDDDRFTLEFRHVSFCYPGSTQEVLKDFSIKFRIGERLAVVGKNGSGKTTFIKLLCRLYDPTEGEILLNGIDIRKFDYREYISLFSVVFQDFVIPAFPLGQNVAAAMEYDEEKARSALERVGLKELVDAMGRGLETPLYTDFDSTGVDVSGGEAQKIAIARALYHDTPFVILDEPTAALDPLAEYEVYSKFDELVGSKTAVYISHRLSSCQFCNDILVIDGGRAVQRGAHEELIQESEGLYYRLWNAQAQYYQKETPDF